MSDQTPRFESALNMVEDFTSLSQRAKDALPIEIGRNGQFVTWYTPWDIQFQSGSRAIMNALSGKKIMLTELFIRSRGDIFTLLSGSNLVIKDSSTVQVQSAFGWNVFGAGLTAANSIARIGLPGGLQSNLTGGPALVSGDVILSNSIAAGGSGIVDCYMTGCYL